MPLVTIPFFILIFIIVGLTCLIFHLEVKINRQTLILRLLIYRLDSIEAERKEM